jgi:hypothetical protein
VFAGSLGVTSANPRFTYSVDSFDVLSADSDATPRPRASTRSIARCRPVPSSRSLRTRPSRRWSRGQGQLLTSTLSCGGRARLARCRDPRGGLPPVRGRRHAKPCRARTA